jgi:hypothetical protein
MTPIEEVLELRSDPGMQSLAQEAVDFLGMFGWWKSIVSGSLCRNIESHFGLFYFVLEPLLGAPDKVWVIVGDVPPSILFVKEFPEEREVISEYVCGLEAWAERVENGRSVKDIAPMLYRRSRRILPATSENADLARRRASLIRQNLLEDAIDQ